jgi:hypothetical protein
MVPESSPPAPPHSGATVQFDRIEALLRRILDLQRFDDFTTPHALQSGVSKSCSANSHGCEPHCTTIASPTAPGS